MAQDLFQYDRMVERALRGVVRDALQQAAREGLRSAHHFYIGFATEMPGVAIPDYLRGKYPGEMTIVLQHQFWELEIGEEAFSITLSFQKQLERLTIPFAAIRSFADPSVNFALEFAGPAVGLVDTAKLPAAVDAAPQPEEKPQEKPAGEVVSLDRFRKR
jgi:uncharacterized protein